MSEFEVMLANARSTAATSLSPTPCPESLSDITERLEELAKQENAYTLKCRLNINKRQIEDAEIEQIYTEEGEKYRAILAAQTHKEEQCKERRAVEDIEIRNHGRMLDDEEDARCFIQLIGRRADFGYRTFDGDGSGLGYINHSIKHHGRKPSC